MERMIVWWSELTHSDLQIDVEFEDQHYVLDTTECWSQAGLCLNPGSANC